jgi:hypothetical protein
MEELATEPADFRASAAKNSAALLRAFSIEFKLMAPGDERLMAAKPSL